MIKYTVDGLSRFRDEYLTSFLRSLINLISKMQRVFNMICMINLFSGYVCML